VTANVNYYMAELDRPGIEGEKYDRVQVDVAFKF